MASYQTAQKKALIDFMNRNCEASFTVEELCEMIKKENSCDAVPGKSTVYRIIAALVEEGTVKRMVKGNSRRFVYQLAAGEHCHSHLHMKCTSCGKLLHMDDGESYNILNQVVAKSSFFVDESQTVLMGKCGDCKKA